MKHSFIFILSFVFAFASIKGTSQITFRHVYGGTGEDHGRAIQQTPDGGYIVTGSTGSFGNGTSDVYLFKIDSMGILQWSKTYGGNNVDWGQDIKVLPDSGFIITGYTNSFGNGGYDVYLLRTDSLGDTLWTRTYGGTDWDFGHKVIHTSDNGFAIVGETQSYGAGDKNVYLIKTDENGDTLWTKTYGGDSVDVGYGIVENLFGGYFITGKTKSYGAGKEDIYLIRINNQGDTIFTKTYGGAELDIAKDIVQSADSNIVFGGTFASYGLGAKDIYVSKVDTNGTFMWEENLGGADDDEGISITNTNDEGFGIVGSTKSFGGGIEDFIFYKITKNGVYQFGENYGSSKSEVAFSIFSDTLKNEYIIAGTTESYGNGFNDVWLIKTDFLGETANNNVDTTMDPLTVMITQSGENIILFPNPTHGEINIYGSDVNNSTQINIFDLSGKKLNIAITNNTFQIQRKGIYIVQIIQEGKPFRKKIIVY